MKVVITNPPWRTKSGRGLRTNSRWPYTKETDIFAFPIYLAYTAAVLEKEKFDVKVIDAVIKDMTVDEFVNEIKKENPMLVLMETSTPSIYIDLDTAKRLKDNVECKIALCGAHVSVFHKEIVEQNPFVDFVIRGEFEYTTRDLANALKNKKIMREIEGITYREKGQVIVNKDRDLIEDLDELPFPAYHLFDIYAYGKHGARLEKNVTMISSRGCPYRCIYCLWPQTMYGHKWRARSAKNVVDEMEMVKKKYDAKEVFFDDDTFTISKERVKEICNEILNRNLKIRWQCYGHVGNLDIETLNLMKKANCYMIRYGVESGSDETLLRIKKGTTINRIKEAFELTKKSGIKTFGSFMLGLPGDNKAKCEKTIQFAKELDPEFVQFSIVTPFPGTEFYYELKNKGQIIAKNWDEFDGNLIPVYELPDLSRKDMQKMLAKAWRGFYLRPKKVWQILRKINSPAVLVRTLRGAYSIFKGRL